VGKINIYDKIMIENQKKPKLSQSKKFFLHKTPSNTWFGNEIHSFLSRADARVFFWFLALTSFTVCDAYRYIVCQAWLLTLKSRSCREYLIPTENIIVLDHFCLNFLEEI